MNARLQMLRALAQNPAGNPVATAFAVAILVCALLLVIVALLAWALPARTPHHRRKRRRRVSEDGTTRPRHPYGGLVLTVVVAAAAVALGYGTTAQTSFCASVCHATSKAAESWRASPHSGVPCIRCHEGIPVLSAVPALFSRAYSAYAEVTRREGGHASAVPSSRCLDCHSAVAGNLTVNSAGLAMRHSDVIAAGAACEDCHGMQGHGPSQAPLMASCLRCHDGRVAATECDTCHRRGADALIRARDTRFGKVKLPDKPTCDGCHSEAPCDKCHGLRMPHPVGYQDPRMHAAPAAFDRKQKLCYRCHTFGDCSACHLPFNAHVPNWKEVHKKYPRDTAWCVSCHETPDMCGTCHPD